MGSSDGEFGLWGVRMGSSDGEFGWGSDVIRTPSEQVGVRTKFVRTPYELGTELTRVSHESALNPWQSVALCIFEVYLQSSVSSMCLRRDTLERYTRRCTLIEDTHFSLERYTGIWSFIMIKSNRCAILPECDTLV